MPGSCPSSMQPMRCEVPGCANVGQYSCLVKVLSPVGAESSLYRLHYLPQDLALAFFFLKEDKEKEREKKDLAMHG